MRAMDEIRERAAVFCATPVAAAEKMASVMTRDYFYAEAAKGKRSDFKKLMRTMPDAPALKGAGR